MSDTNDPVHRWHAYMRDPSPEGLDAMIAEDAVFISPVVHTPQRGKPLVMKYLLAAADVLGNESFAYIGEWRAERSAILEFEVTVKDVQINGIDMVWWNEAGLITRFKVMVRPLKAISMLHAMMAAELMRAETA